MSGIDDHLYEQLMSRPFWEAPNPEMPVHRIQRCFDLYDGRAVADWLYAQSATVACARTSQWLGALESALHQRYEMPPTSLVQAFRERVLAHLWDTLEEAFAETVLPLYHTAPNDASTLLLPTAIEAFLHLLETVDFPRLATSTRFWQWLQDTLPRQDMAHSTASAIDTTAALDRLFEGLTQRYPDLASETRWHLAHQARVLAAWLATAVATGWERYKVHGLFVSQARGVVRDLWVSVRIGHGAEIASTLQLEHDASGKLTAGAFAWQRSLQAAVSAACQYAHRERPEDTELAVHLFLDEDGQPACYQGPSLGLAVALAVLARLTQHQVNRRVAVTGQVLADGTLAKVDGISEKLHGVVTYNARLASGLLRGEPIADVVLPRENAETVDAHAWQAHGITVHGAATLHEAVEAYGLLNPWATVAHTDLETASPVLSSVTSALAELDDLQRCVLLYPYTSSADEVLHALAHLWAGRHRTRRETPVPVQLKLLPFVQQASLVQQVLHQIGGAGGGTTGLDRGLVVRQLYRGGFLLLLSGLDDLVPAETPPAYLRSLLAELSNPPVSSNAVVFACRQSTWEWLRPVFAQAVPAFTPLPLSATRSTCFDGPQQALLRTAATRLAVCRRSWLPPRTPAAPLPRPSAEEFFYGGTSAYPAPLAFDIHVYERLADGMRTASQPLAHVIAGSAEGQRLLLLGGAGAGKSTQLLRLVFDCCARQSPSPLRDVYAPLLIELGGKCDCRGHDTWDGFLQRLLDDVRWADGLSVHHFAWELRHTPRLLVMLDGLDEIKPEGLNTRAHIAALLDRFVHLLHPSSWVILASREQERGRAHESMLSALEGQRGVWRTLVMDDLRLNPALLHSYLQRVIPEASLVEGLMQALQGRVSVLTNPMLVHLFAPIAPQQLVGQALNPGMIYRAAMETWLDDELHVRGAPRIVGMQAPPGKTLQQVMGGLLGVLAQGMVEQGVYTVEPVEAREIFVQFITTCLTQGVRLPGWWPVTDLAQQPVGVVGTQVQVDDLDLLVAALMELCVMQ